MVRCCTIHKIQVFQSKCIETFWTRHLDRHFSFESWKCKKTCLVTNLPYWIKHSLVADACEIFKASVPVFYLFWSYTCQKCKYSHDLYIPQKPQQGPFQQALTCGCAIKNELETSWSFTINMRKEFTLRLLPLKFVWSVILATQIYR